MPRNVCTVEGCERFAKYFGICQLHHRRWQSTGSFAERPWGEWGITHGGSRGNREPLYQVWRTMLSRCENPSVASYPDYGGRGIEVCEAWHGYEPFRTWASAHGYSRGLTLDRINTNGPYEAENCRWTTPSVQSRNKRNNRWIAAFGERKILTDWVEDPRCTVTWRTVSDRLKAGWSEQDAVGLPGKTMGYRRKSA